MNRSLLSSIAFYWLTISGTLHFLVDVVSQAARHKRLPGPETTLYYGQHSAFSLGQVVFGLCGLWIVQRAAREGAYTPILVLGLVASAGWFAIVYFTMEYWQPRVGVAVFAAILLATLLLTKAGDGAR